MPNNPNNHDQLELLETTLRAAVPTEEPLNPELQARIVASFRAESRRHRGVVRLRRFTIAAALAASVLLAITILVMSWPTDNQPRAIVDTMGYDESLFAFAKFPPTPVMMDDSMAAVEEFAANSVVREMQDLARDASEIGIAMLAAIPDDVVGRTNAGWWSGSLEK
jgi:hypothetical protein